MIPLLILLCFCFPCFLFPYLAPHLEGAWNPENRVRPKDREGADQQRRHAPKGHKQVGILLWIMMRGVCQVSRKTAARAGMALLTGLHHVLPAQMRVRIIHIQNVVCAMTVVALGRLGVSQLRDLSVISLEVALRHIFVTAATTAHDLQPEDVAIRSNNGMRGVTIATDRQLLVCLRHRRRVHAVRKLHLYPAMALTTGAAQILRIYARLRIRCWQYTMRRVAVGTRRGHRQSTLKQTFTVNALGVLRRDLVLRAGIAQCGFLAFAMAARAQRRNIGRIRGRRRVVFAQNLVRAMALLAARGIRVRLVCRKRLAMFAAQELLSNRVMALRTVNLLRNGFARTYP